MKQLIFTLLMAFTLCTAMRGETRIVTENDSLGNKKRVIELRDTLISGKIVHDTLSVTIYDKPTAATNEATNDQKHHNTSGWNWGEWDMGEQASEALIAITAIVFVFGLPVLVVFIVFFFRYKNRKAKYRLIEQALASGQTLPENFLKNNETNNQKSKAIQNIFTGIGLFIFLWAITSNFGVGCVGLLIMFTGFGQLVIHYSQQPPKEKPSVRIEKDEKR